MLPFRVVFLKADNAYPDETALLGSANLGKGVDRGKKQAAAPAGRPTSCSRPDPITAAPSPGSATRSTCCCWNRCPSPIRGRGSSSYRPVLHAKPFIKKGSLTTYLKRAIPSNPEGMPVLSKRIFFLIMQTQSSCKHVKSRRLNA